MSIGLRLLAKLSSPTEEPERLLERMATWIQYKCAEVLPRTRPGFVESFPTLFCKFHPGAEEVELSLADPEHLIASANTSTVGPGYHIYLCSVLVDLARDFQASWQHPDDDSDDYSDEADYFFTGDGQRVFDNMTAWLKALAGTFFEDFAEQDLTGNTLCMPMDVVFESADSVITPLGPRDRAWLEKTSRDGESGKDFFAWWTPGLTAEYFLGRALTQMWRNVRWRAPVNDAEREVLRQTADSLHRAYQLDPSLQYPWAEWAEILGYLDTDDATAHLVRAHRSGVATLGYRRGSVTVVLPGGWRMCLPGSFSEFEADESNDLFALDPPKKVWFTAYKFNEPLSHSEFASRRQEMLAARPQYLRESDHYVAKATVQRRTTEAGEDYFLLSSSNLFASGRSVCSMVFSRSEELDSVLEIWKSIQPRAASTSEST